MSDFDQPVEFIFRSDPGYSVDLLTVARGLTQFHHLIDRSYAVSAGHLRISDVDRLRYKILVSSNFEPGSLHVRTVIAMTEQTLFGGLVTPHVIWSQALEAYRFLVAWLSARRAGQPATIATTGEGNITVVGNGNQITVVSPGAFETAARSQPTIRRLARMINDGAAAEMVATDSRGESISFSAENRDLLSHLELVRHETLEFLADIYHFNKNDGYGTLRVLNDVPGLRAGNYPFSVVSNESRLLYVASMAEHQVRVFGLPEIVQDLGGPRVTRIYVIGVALRSEDGSASVD